MRAGGSELAKAERNEVGAHHSESERARRDLELLVRYRRDGDVRARDELFERLMPLVHQLARRYLRTPGQFDDLVQVACLGLVKAVERFDVERGLPFLRYAVPTMLGEIKRHFRDTGWAAHVPRGMQERVMEMKKAMAELGTVLGRSPSAAELAQELGVEIEDVLETMEAATAYGSISLEAPHGRNEDGDAEPLGDSLGDTDPAYALAEDVAVVFPALAVLPEREREIVRMRFEEDLTQSEIAERVGISQMHVSRLLRRALERVRTVVEADRSHARSG